MSWLGAWRALGSVAAASGLPALLERDPRARAERLGAVPDGAGRAPLWVHAASVGETAAAGALLAAVRARAPRAVALSVTTRTGRERARALAPDLGPFHPPLDAPGPVRRALARLAPSAFVALETELWPTLLDELSRRGVPWGVASGRLSDRGFARKRRVRGLYAAVLARVTAIGARTEADAERFVALGAPAGRVAVTGDLKEDRAVAPWTPPPDGPPAWIAACTRPGEEEIVLAATAVLRARVPDGRLILAPRHPERFEEAARLAERTGWTPQRWVERDEPAPEGWSLLLVDRMGVLDEAYRRARVAFVGGSLVPLGGHSPWEAAGAGRAVITGPHVTACAGAVAALQAAGAATTAADAAALADAVEPFLRDAGRATRGGRSAHAVLAARAGAGEATVAHFRARGLLA